MRISSQYLTNYTVSEINRKEAAVARLQEQISSGKQLHKASDNPASTPAVENLDAALLRIDQYDKSATIVEQRLKQEEEVLGNVINAFQRLKEISLASSSGVVTQGKLEAYKAETAQLFDQILDYGNTQATNGKFLFAGAKTSTKPFALANGSVTYQGDQTQNQVNISDSRSIKNTDTGDQLFFRIASGNGYFNVDADAGNTGTGIIDTGSITNPAAYQNEDFSIEFTAPDTFNILDGTGNTVLANQAYTSDAQIQFSGLNVTITGSPEAGDQFNITPSRNQDVFTTVQNMLSTLTTAPTTKSEYSQFNVSMGIANTNIDQALDHLQAKRSHVGSRLGYIEITKNENSSTQFHMAETRAKIEDTNYAEAISQLQTEMTTLEALRQSFTRMSSMSLFNYL